MCVFITCIQTQLVAQPMKIWFIILSRPSLGSAPFASMQHLKEQMLRFISYFNQIIVKPIILDLCL